MGDPEVFRGRGRLRLLLDTHVLIWAADKRLGDETREIVEEGANTIFVSAVTVWEIEIKRALNKLRTVEDTIRLVDESGFERLGISYEHAREAGRLPLFHGDPFDRMLVAQARLEGLTLATGDPKVKRYNVPVLDVTPG
ncbi:MAG: type II toxin-antitoxin system VapC family toxin [Solirubrobacteraceae bacterium]